MVERRRVVGITYLVNRVGDATKTEVLFQLDDQRDLVALPATRQPPAWIGVDENSPPLIEMILNYREQLIARPTAAGPDRLPTSWTDRSLVVHGDRLPAGNHDRVVRNSLESMPVFFAHRSPLNELIAYRAHKN